MTDKEKLEAIRAEIHRLVDVRGYDREMANDLFTFMDSLPNEPVSKRFAFKSIPRLLEMIEPTDRAKSYVTKLADAFDSEGYYTDAKIVRERLKIMNGEKVAMATMDEEPVSDELEKVVEEIVDPTVLNAYGVKEIANRLRRTMIEPVSEDLEDDNSFEELLQEIYVKYNKEISIEKLLDIASNFAKWQRKQDKMVEKLTEKNYATGFEACKQQMMKDATEVTVHIEAGNYPYIPQMELYDYDKDIPLAKEGDRYKVVLIKEAEL